MSLAQRIAAKRHNNRKTIEVAAWGDDEPLFIYVGQLTCADVSKLQRKHPEFLTKPNIDSMVDLIIHKAEDKNGDKLFTLEDKPTLMRESVTVISQVAGQMFGTVEAAEDLGND